MISALLMPQGREGSIGDGEQNVERDRAPARLSAIRSSWRKTMMPCAHPEALSSSELADS